MIFALIILALSIAALGVALWNALAWPAVTTTVKEAADDNEDDAAIDESATDQGLSILIPARDEEANIAACVAASLKQGRLVREVLVYDDHSTDQTARIVGEYALSDARVRLVAAVPLPAGWCGKTFACARLAEAARGRWLLFIDADARLAPIAAGRIVAAAEARAATLLSCWPGLEMRGFWERTLMPLLNFVVFTLFPAPLSFARPRDAALGLAHGACLLARRDVYARVGGHSDVRDELFEDVRLAQLWRARGETSLCLDGQDVVRVRMYNSLADIWRGFQKNFYPAFRRPASFWLFIALHLIVFLLPFVLAPLVHAQLFSLIMFVAAACVLMTRAVLAVRFKHSLWSVLLHPLGEAILIALGVSSWWRCRSGRGVVWKGRRYRAGAQGEETRA